MGVLVQIRDVPEEVHRTLKVRAAQQGTSLSEYLRQELERVAAMPTPAELAALPDSREPMGITPKIAAEVIREIRDERS